MLTIDSVTLRYGDHDILAGCYLAAAKGEVVGLLGRNGSGKSSLLKIIFGSLKANNSHLRIDDEIIRSAYRTRKVAYLPQDPFLPAFLTVEFLLKKCPNLPGEALTFLEPLRAKSVSELSGGELRILEFLWLLQLPAEYVLLDEPFSGIAPIHVEFLQKMIKQVGAERCIILTDHLYRALLPISSRVLLLHNKSVYPIRDESELGFYGYIPDSY
ncbi:ATP-binding cassette domain-containing protein [Desertivirga arenae]|uniref:ATP-binding cassette domain-containing protein n=1 Tax=Desertivirga arenae TaxID=2810309 RepID=UPI001A964E07|nr:ABC transporter ATP-binding protein [Pedobacter sp. SYSU D00823]